MTYTCRQMSLHPTRTTGCGQRSSLDPATLPGRAYELWLVPFLNANNAVTVSGCLELRPFGFLGDDLQNARALVFPNEDSVDGDSQIFGQLALRFDLPVSLR